MDDGTAPLAFDDDDEAVGMVMAPGALTDRGMMMDGVEKWVSSVNRFRGFGNRLYQT